MIDYSVSARRKSYRQNIETFLKLFYFGRLPNDRISSIFGFTEYCPLYGGRPYRSTELTCMDIEWMYNRDIGYKIPIQNLYATYEDYKKSYEFLKKYHKNGNSVIVSKPDLAKWIRNDFPKYKIEASFIRRLDTVEKANRDIVSDLFDYIVPDPATFAYDYDSLKLLKDKNKVRLFANIRCEFFCKNRPCYTYISTLNKNHTAKLKSNRDDFKSCEENIRKKELFFDVEKYKQLGFTHFKIVNLDSRLFGTNYASPITFIK